MTMSVPAFWRRTQPLFPARPPTSYAAHDLPLLTNRPRRAKTCQCASHSSFAQLCFMLLLDACLSSLGGLLSLWSTSTDQRSPHDNEANTTKLYVIKALTPTPETHGLFSPLTSRFFISYPWLVLVVCPWSRPLASLFFGLFICKMGVILALTP